MLSHPKYICRTIFKLQHQVRVLILATLCCWCALFCWTQKSVAQDDVKFREFDRNRVHSPRELARDLNYLFFKDKKNPLSDIDPEKLKKLRELGDNFFENLSDDQKKQAQDFAEKFMRDKGLDSPEGKQLMDQLGVSPEMQSELAKEFGDNDPADFERFRDLFKNSNRPSGIGKNGTHNSEARQRGKRSEMPAGEVRKDRPEDFRGQGGPPKTAHKDLPKDLFETLPNELKGKSSTRRKGQPGDLAKGKSARDLDKQFSDAAKANADRNAPRFPGSKDSNPDGIRDRDSNSGAPGSRNGKGGLGADGKSAADMIAKGKDAASKLLERGKGASKGQPKNGVGKGTASKADSKRLADKDREIGKELLEMLEGIEHDPSSSQAAKGKSKTGKAVRGSAKTAKKDSQKGPRIGGVGGQSNPQLDETFKSWIQMEAFKKGLREFQERRGPSDFQRRSLESAFKKGVNGLGKSMGKQDGISDSDFADKLDRVLFKAAQDSVQGGAQQDGDSEGIGGSVENTLDGLLDRVSEAATKRQKERRKRQHEKMVKAQTNKVNQFPLDPDRPFQSDGGSGSNGGTDALGAAAEMFESIPELPAFEPKKILIYLAIFASAILLLYLLLRKFAVGKTSSAARKFGRSFRGAKIHSPKDLVEAVDYFIVQKFGGRSQWWNAKHAQDMLCAGAPGYSAKISELLKDYVRARYTRADVTLSPEEQLNYKMTLQELAKEVPGEIESSADASQDQG